MQHLLNTLRKIAPDRVLENAPMSRYTTFRVGGPADALFLPASVEELQEALAAAKAQGIPVCLIGNGSNLIVRDGGIRGLVIALGEPFSELRVEGAQVWAQAGARLSAVAAAAQRAGLAGLEFASGIPGTLGGGCAMNAGAYGGELKDVLVWADVLLDGELRRLSRDEMEMGYRSTLPLRRGAIVVSACFELHSDDPEAIQERMRDLANRRREKQPLNLPSAGSTFKRPEGYFAAKLIDDAGMKGYSVGDAQVSEKHAGFVINKNNASAADVLALMEQIQKTVKEKFGVDLVPEVRVIGE